MYINHLKLRNWRNFRAVDVRLADRSFVIGPNGSGKSNFLDVFRFLRDVAGEGLFKAVQTHRGGVAALRSRAAKPRASIEIEITLTDAADVWTYRLVFNDDKLNRPLIRREEVFLNRDLIEQRPNHDDGADPERLYFTSIEQVVANHQFRRLSDFFRSVCDQNLVPQIVRETAAASAPQRADDPAGRHFMLRLWRTPAKTRAARLKKIGAALRVAVPDLAAISMDVDTLGTPHLLVDYAHARANDKRHDERDLSDGTLRLLGLLWSLFDGAGPLLLEEPETSLHPEVVRQLAQIVERINRSRNIRRQVMISTHSEELLGDKGIAAEEILRLQPGKAGTEIREADDQDKALVGHGLTVADVILPKSAAPDVAQLAFSF